jgi:hypothetical protein
MGVRTTTDIFLPIFPGKVSKDVMVAHRHPDVPLIVRHKKKYTDHQTTLHPFSFFIHL